ncbi:MAG: LPP20 family lipoprotein, partial [Planctomycetes bacterium]|nr:LPP20 family lipoprotein [Planctomycetota bacterium]
MKHVKKLAASLSLICVFVAVASVRAGDPASDAQNKLLAKRAAEADCYRKLAETVNGVKLNSSTYVRDFVTESDEIRTAVNTFVKGIRLGPPRYYDDGTCEV